MLYFRTNILVLVLASLSLVSWGGTTSAQETTDVLPVATDAPISAADAGGADTGEMPILTGVETPTEAPVVGGVDVSAMPILGGVGTPTETPTGTPQPTGGEATTTPPVAMVGADYCTFAPDPTCYSNSNGKPECCLDDAIECPADAAPCDVVDADASAPPTPQSTDTSVIPTPSLSTQAPTTAQATETSIIPTPNPTQVPSAGVEPPLLGASFCTYSPDPACYSNNGKPDCCMDDAIECPADAPPCDVVGSETETPTKAPIVFAGFQKCSANDVCKEDGLEGNCCPNEDGTILDCCYGITESPVAVGADPSESPATSMPLGNTPTGGPIDAEPTTSVPTTEAAVPAVPTTPPPQPETPTQEQTPPAPDPNDTSESSSSSNVDIKISAAVVVSGVRFVAVAVGVVTTAAVVAVL